DHTCNNRSRQPRTQPALETCSVVADADAEDAAPGVGDEQPPERAGDNDERDARPRAAAAVRSWGHTEPRVRAFVHATGGAVACFVECGAHLLSLLELGLEALEPALVPVLPRREPEHGPKCAEQPMRCRAGARAQTPEARRRVRMCIDSVAHGAHQRDPWVRRPGFAGAAASTGAEPCLLGRLGNREERDLLPMRLL